MPKKRKRIVSVVHRLDREMDTERAHEAMQLIGCITYLLGGELRIPIKKIAYNYPRPMPIWQRALNYAISVIGKDTEVDPKTLSLAMHLGVVKDGTDLLIAIGDLKNENSSRPHGTTIHWEVIEDEQEQEVQEQEGVQGCQQDSQRDQGGHEGQEGRRSGGSPKCRPARSGHESRVQGDHAPRHARGASQDAPGA